MLELTRFYCIRYIHIKHISDQDEGLDALSSVLQRQKQMAIDIGNEVDHQDGKEFSFNFIIILII